LPIASVKLPSEPNTVPLLLYAFAKPDYKYKYADQSSGNISSGPFLQQKSVKGTVVQQDGESLPGANIVIQGTTMGTAADAKGYFKLDNVPDDGLLVVSFVGFKSRILKPVFTSEMSITMVRDTVRYNNLNISSPPPPPSPELPPPPSNPGFKPGPVNPETEPLPLARCALHRETKRTAAFSVRKGRRFGV